MLGRVLVEILLFLIPFAVFLVYRAASKDLKVRDRWPLTRLVIAGGVLAAVALIITPLLEPSTPKDCLADPVRYDNGQEKKGSLVSCDTLQQQQPQTEPTTTRPPPVAPRDRGG